MENSAAAYSKEIASHYKAYRPKLHSVLLKKCLQTDSFQRGLDVGCGVGHSSVALTSYCKKVIGLEPSTFMLQQAHQHPQVCYESVYTKVSKPYDLLCFFGVLFYLTDEEVKQYLDGLIASGSLLVADFKIDYDLATQRMQLKPFALNYEHIPTQNLLTQQARLLKSEVFSSSFECTTRELLHLMMTEPHIESALIQRFKTSKFALLQTEISNFFTEDVVRLQAELNYSLYKKN